jgi:hypothetical protein
MPNGKSNSGGGASDITVGVDTSRHKAMVDAFAELVRAAQDAAPRFGACESVATGPRK